LINRDVRAGSPYNGVVLGMSIRQKAPVMRILAVLRGESPFGTRARRPSDRPVVKRVKRSISILSRADGSTKCSICLGLIKRSLPRIECRCGIRFHQSCAVRVGICPLCGEEIDIPPSAVSVIDAAEEPIRNMPMFQEDRLFLLEDRLLLGDIDRDTYYELKSKIMDALEEPSICPECGTRLYPGEECDCRFSTDVKCPECGSSVQEDIRFCRSCGVVYDPGFIEELFQCSSCGRIVTSSERLCACGALLLDPGDTLCPECNALVPIGSSSCKQCGKMLFVELLQCPICGSEVGPMDFDCSCGAIFEDRIDRIECPECGEDVSVDDRYCRYCGVRFRSDRFSSYYELAIEK